MGESRPPVMAFIHDDFLLNSATARRLYHEFAADEPILDFHCHLSPRDIALNRRFNNLFEIWLEGDHYKWRAMRANGVSEKLCTGYSDPFAKFKAWAGTVPRTLRNPLYHWTHLELKRYFEIDELLNESSAERIWHEANAKLSTPEFTTQGILQKFRVNTLCTTDDPSDDLSNHQAITRLQLSTKVFPAFRPDKALAIHRLEPFNIWVDRLAESNGKKIDELPDLLEALRLRVDYFHHNGCRISDHGLDLCYASFCPESVAAGIFAKARHHQFVANEEQVQFASFIMLFLGHLYAEKGWTMQLHLGAMRNTNTRMLLELGPDTGFDSIGDFPQASTLIAYLDRLEQESSLPKTIIYNANPANNYLFASAIGNYQDGSFPGKIQFGSGWWFLDQKESMEWQLNALSNIGLISLFIGMTTDSRSFMSYPRHEYFRRVLCNLVGHDVESGEAPDDESLLGSMIRNICYENARNYFGLQTN